MTPERWMVVRPSRKIPGGWRVVRSGLSEEMARRIAAERANHEAMSTSMLYEVLKGGDGSCLNTRFRMA